MILIFLNSTLRLMMKLLFVINIEYDQETQFDNMISYIVIIEKEIKDVINPL